MEKNQDQLTKAIKKTVKEIKIQNQTLFWILVIVSIDLVQGVLGRTSMEQNLIKLFG